MNLSIEQLEKSGSFTSAPVEKEIRWKQKGEELTATVYVRPLSYISAKSDLTSRKTGHDPVAGRIAACICDENGKAIFTPEDITGDAVPDRGPLDGNLSMELLRVIGEVSSLGKSPASSAPKTKSGAS